MTKEPRIALPWPSSGLMGEPTLSTNGGDLHVAMQFVAGGRKGRTRLIFARQRAYRRRSEVHCTKWHVEDALDAVCEVRSSDWTVELCESTTPAWRNRWVMRHFMIYLDNFGCLEVVAESVSLALSQNDSDAIRRGAGL
jgi:hypothetical protein